MTAAAQTPAQFFQLHLRQVPRPPPDLLSVPSTFPATQLPQHLL